MPREVVTTVFFAVIFPASSLVCVVLLKSSCLVFTTVGFPSSSCTVTSCVIPFTAMNASCLSKPSGRLAKYKTNATAAAAAAIHTAIFFLCLATGCLPHVSANFSHSASTSGAGREVRPIAILSRCCSSSVGIRCSVSVLYLLYSSFIVGCLL